MHLLQIDKINTIHSKWSLVKTVVILSENGCHFVSCSATAVRQGQ